LADVLVMARMPEACCAVTAITTIPMRLSMLGFFSNESQEWLPVASVKPEEANHYSRKGLLQLGLCLDLLRVDDCVRVARIMSVMVHFFENNESFRVAIPGREPSRRLRDKRQTGQDK
jgi:hypothetical protein